MSKHASFLPPAPSAVDLLSDDQGLSALILKEVRDAIILQDVRGQIEWINQGCVRMFGWSLDEIRGRHPSAFVVPPEHRPTHDEIETFRYRLGTGLFNRVRAAEVIRRDGSRFWTQQRYAVIRPQAAAAEPKVLVICKDLSDAAETDRALKSIRDDLEHTATHDDLTGLANRKKLKSYLASRPVRERIAQGRLGMLQLDIDKFKEINDTLGHAAGDETLVHVAKALRQISGPQDLPCRTGGDEFLLMCFDVTGEADLMQRAQSLFRALDVPLRWSTQEIKVGTSIGASLPIDARTTGEAMIRMADQALYAAKNRGRGQAVFYTERLGRVQKAQTQLAQDLRRAVEERQFLVHLQPQLNLAENRIVGCEALLRWAHPRRGLLAPPDFLDAAQRNGLLARLDMQSMTLALDALVHLRAAGHAEFRLSLNVSSSVLVEERYPERLEKALKSRDIHPASICVEVLETALLDRVGKGALAAIGRLKQLGVRVALDNFGTGYAGLAHMSSVNVDGLKLDRAMVARLEEDPRNRMVVRATLRLGHLLGMEMVAEGVETQEQLEILRRAGCPLIQGFGIAAPMEIGDLLLWLSDRRENADEDQGWSSLADLTTA